MTRQRKQLIAVWVALTVVAQVFVLSLMYATGIIEGVDRGRAEAKRNKAEHDKIMRGIGVCTWAKMYADYVECGGDVPSPKKPGPIVCDADVEKCS